MKNYNKFYKMTLNGMWLGVSIDCCHCGQTNEKKAPVKCFKCEYCEKLNNPVSLTIY